MSQKSPCDSSTMLVFPARPRVVELAFDLALMRNMTLVSFRCKADTAGLLIHVWQENEWRYVTFPDFCSLKFVSRPPKIAIIIGDDQTVPAAILRGMERPCKTARVQTVNLPDLLNGLSPYFKFSSREWKQLAEKYDLKLKEIASPSTKPIMPSEETRPQEGGPTSSTQVEKNAAMPSSNKPLLQARDPEKEGEQRPTNDFQLKLGNEDQINLVWIAPLSIWVSRYEISNNQYSHFDRAHDPKPYYCHILNMPDQPAVFVSWEDANNYCGWLNRNFGREIPPGYEFRLPTEKEWLIYATCEQNRKYPWGDRWPPPNSLNYRGMEGSSIIYNLVHDEQFIRNHNDGFVVTAPVDKSGTNEWGLCGVGGNVWEWCGDWFDETKITRALRGAGWNNYEPSIIAVTNRSAALPDKSNAMIGFRVVVAPRPSPGALRGLTGL